MPRDTAPSRTRAGAPPIRAAPRRRAGVPTAQAGQPYPTRVGNSLRPSNQGTQRRPPALPEGSPPNDAQERVRDDPDHADCRAVFKKADRDRAQLVAQLSRQRQEAADVARQFGVERTQLNGQSRKLNLDLQKAKEEVRQLKQENLDLQKRFDESTPDQGTYMRRDEYEKTLDELGKLSSSVTRTIGLKKSESKSDAENVYMTKAMPPSDVLQSPWAQPGQFDMLDNAVVPDDIAPMLSTSEALALPDFDTYGEMS